MNEPKTVIKHTRTITTFYLSDGDGYDLAKNLEGFLTELRLPDSYEGGDVLAVSSGDEEIDEVVWLGTAPGHLENELEEYSVPYDMTMEAWNKKR
jgi:hypothetical protein